MSATSAILWTRTPTEADVVAELSSTADFGQVTALPAAHSTQTSDFTVKVTATGLTPGTLYYYRFRSGGNVSAVGSFRTAYAADQDAPVTIGFTGDAHWAWKPYPLLASLVKEPLDTFIFLGDLIYESRNLETGKNGTIAAESLDDFRWKYRENREPRPGSATGMVPMLDLYAHFGQYSVFDNHETAASKQKGARRTSPAAPTPRDSSSTRPKVSAIESGPTASISRLKTPPSAGPAIPAWTGPSSFTGRCPGERTSSCSSWMTEATATRRCPMRPIPRPPTARAPCSARPAGSKAEGGEPM